jgi:hypothetical protein
MVTSFYTVPNLSFIHILLSCALELMYSRSEVFTAMKNQVGLPLVWRCKQLDPLILCFPATSLHYTTSQLRRPRLDVYHFLSPIQKLKPFTSYHLPVTFFWAAVGLASSDRRHTQALLPRQGSSPWGGSHFLRPGGTLSAQTSAPTHLLRQSSSPENSAPVQVLATSPKCVAIHLSYSSFCNSSVNT